MKNFPLILAAMAAAVTLGASTARADCASDFQSLRGEMDEKGKALQAASKKKAPPQELCPLFRAYAAAEGKVAKWLADNKEWCQIPPDIATQAKANNAKTASVRDRVCQAAAQGAAGGGAPAGPPPQGSISSALGITTGYQLGQSGGSGGGVFDTLSGNALRK